MKDLRICYTDNTNMGDAINKYIVRDVFGMNPVCCDLYKCDISGIGSGLRRFFVRPNCKGNIKKIVLGNMRPAHMIIWSSGFLERPYGDEIPTRRKMRFASTRGELSKKYIEKIIKKDIDCSTGDAGLLASELIRNETINKKYSIGIIPHYKEKDHPVFDILKTIKDSVVIDVMANPIDTLRTLASCETAVSTSLHGLIFCDSLHIPNTHLHVTNDVYRDGFKYQDYYSSFNMKDEDLIVRNSLDVKAITPKMIKANYRLSYEIVEEKKEEIKKAFWKYIDNEIG